MTKHNQRIERRLHRLGFGIRLRVFVRACAWVVAAVLVAAMASVVADWGLYRLTLQHMTVWQRLFVNGLCLIPVVVALRKWLVPALLMRFSVDDLALVVEKANPELGDRLISALQFARWDTAQVPPASVPFVAKVIEEAGEKVREVSFLRVLRSRAVLKAWGCAIGLLLACGLYAWTQPEMARLWFERNVLLQEAFYPKQTVLRVEGAPRVRVVRGGALTVSVVADPDKVIPEQVVFHMRFPSLGDTSETVAPSADRPMYFVKTFPVVSEPFTFAVSGNDDRTERVEVVLVEPATLKQLEFEVRPPVYTRLPPFTIHRSQGVIELLEDSELVFRGVATKDLASADILLDGRSAGICDAVATGNSGAALRGIEGRVLISAPEPFRPRRSVTIALSDTDGFPNACAASYQIHLLQDTPPVLQLDAIDMGGQITDRATVPMVLTAADDYGVSALHLEWAVRSAPEKVQAYRLRDYTLGVREPGAVEFSFDLEQMKATATAETPRIQTGEFVTMQAVAIDTRPEPIGPNRTLSNPVTFLVVTEDDILTSLLDSQRAMREQLRQVLAIQGEVLARTKEGVTHAGTPTTVGLAYGDVAHCADLQEQIQDQLVGIHERLVGVLLRIRNNRIAANADERRLQDDVIAPLATLQKDHVRPLVARFGVARTIKQGAALGETLRQLAGQQNAAIELLEKILAEMIRVENAQRVERGLRTIIRLSDKARDLMRTPSKKDDPGKREPNDE